MCANIYLGGRMQEKFKIYIIQMHTNTVPSRIVKMFTKYEYSHVGIALDKSCDTIYSFGRKKLNNFLNGGFVVQEKQGEFFKKFKDTKCRIYELNVSEKQYNEIEKELFEIEQKKELFKYDFLGIALRLFKIPVTFKNKYVCSHFVAELLENAAVCTFGKKVCFVAPKDFEQIEGANIVYEGKYSGYTLDTV